MPELAATDLLSNSALYGFETDRAIRRFSMPLKLLRRDMRDHICKWPISVPYLLRVILEAPVVG